MRRFIKLRGSLTLVPGYWKGKLWSCKRVSGITDYLSKVSEQAPALVDVEIWNVMT